MDLLERHRTASLVNLVINDESVYPWVCGPVKGRLDLSEPIESGNYIALMGIYGGFLFWHISDGIYDAHSAVLPQGRGKWAIRAAKEALKWMFSEADAREIMMVVPQGNVAVHALVRMLKAKKTGNLENGWWIEGKQVPCAVYSMTKTDWEKCQQ